MTINEKKKTLIEVTVADIQKTSKYFTFCRKYGYNMKKENPNDKVKISMFDKESWGI